MATPRRHDHHVVRPLLHQHRHPGGETVIIDPWFASPTSPRAVDAVERCDLLLVTHGHFDHMGDAVALASRLRPVVAMHARDEPVARPPAPGRRGCGDRHEQGRHGRGRRAQGDDDPRGPFGWGLERGVARRRCTSASRRGSSIELENGYRIYHAGDTDGVRRHGAHPRAPPARSRDAADRRALHDGPAGGGDGGRAPGGQRRRAAPLRDVPGPGRDAGAVAAGPRRRGAWATCASTRRARVVRSADPGREPGRRSPSPRGWSAARTVRPAGESRPPSVAPPPSNGPPDGPFGGRGRAGESRQARRSSDGPRVGPGTDGRTTSPRMRPQEVGEPSVEPPAGPTDGGHRVPVGRMGLPPSSGTRGRPDQRRNAVLACSFVSWNAGGPRERRGPRTANLVGVTALSSVGTRPSPARS